MSHLEIREVPRGRSERGVHLRTNPKKVQCLLRKDGVNAE